MQSITVLYIVLLFYCSLSYGKFFATVSSLNTTVLYFSPFRALGPFLSPPLFRLLFPKRHISMASCGLHFSADIILSRCPYQIVQINYLSYFQLKKTGRPNRRPLTHNEFSEDLIRHRNIVVLEFVLKSLAARSVCFFFSVF